MDKTASNLTWLDYLSKYDRQFKYNSLMQYIWICASIISLYSQFLSLPYTYTLRLSTVLSRQVANMHMKSVLFSEATGWANSSSNPQILTGKLESLDSFKERIINFLLVGSSYSIPEKPCLLVSLCLDPPLPPPRRMTIKYPFCNAFSKFLS